MNAGHVIRDLEIDSSLLGLAIAEDRIFNR
jgi:hypothetical protein